MVVGYFGWSCQVNWVLAYVPKRLGGNLEDFENVRLMVGSCVRARARL